MVDSINPSGSVTNVLSVGKTQTYEDNKKPEQAASTEPVDQVSLSSEAQSLRDVQKSAKEAYTTLSSHSDVTLSADTNRLNTLV